MILVDAGVLIALADADDAHHSAVTRFFEANADERFAANAVNLAESLVHAVAEELLIEVLDDYELIGIEPLDIPGGGAGAVARVRAETRLRMPDALLVYSCEREGAELVTTDAVLAAASTRRGIRTHLLA